MRMTADDYFYTEFMKIGGQRFLHFMRQQLILNAPVHACYDNISSGIARTLHIFFYLLAVDIVDFNLCPWFDTVCAVCIVYKANLDTVYILYKRQCHPVRR